MSIPACSLGQVVSALHFAAAKHRDQRRKDVHASPYINHPLAVVDVLANEAGVTDVVTLMSGALHDTIEDTKTTKDELVEKFGTEAADVVVEVSDDKTLSKAERKRQQVAHAKHISYRARLVKLADKIVNVRDLIHHTPVGWSHQRIVEYFDWAKEVVDQMRGTHPELERLFDEAHAQRPA